MKRTSWAGACARLFVVGLVGACAATARGRAVDDAAFALALRGDLNGNGELDADEVGNALDFSAASPVRASIPAHAGRAPCLTNATFALPMHPMTTNTWPVLHFYQDNYYNEAGTNVVSSTSVDFSGAAVTNGLTQTFYARFRWDGSAVTNFPSTCWIMLNGYDWQKKSGWGVYVRQEAGVATTTGRIGVMVPQNMNLVDNGCTVKKGAWYDLFLTVSPHGEAQSKATAWLLPVPSARDWADDKKYGFDVPGFWRYTNTWANLPRLSFAPGKTTLRLGAEQMYRDWTTIAASNNNAAKTFRGALARLMLWTRALTEEEMWEVASGFGGALWSVGAENGSADEFAAADADDVHLVTNDWRFMRRALTEASPTLTLKGALPASEAGLDHVVHVAPLFGAAAPDACFVRLSVNGVSAGVFNLARRSGRAAFVPGLLWTRDAEGNATLTLTRLAPFTAPLELDAVTVSGSWCFGTPNASHSEFERETRVAAHVVCGDFDTGHVRRALLGEKDSDVNHTLCFHFFVPADMAGRHEATFETRTTQLAASLDGHAAVGLWLNGAACGARDGVAGGDALSWTIPAEDLQPGMNRLVLSNATSKAVAAAVGATGSWVGFDFYRLRVSRAPDGSLLLVR